MTEKAAEAEEHFWRIRREQRVTGPENAEMKRAQVEGYAMDAGSLRAAMQRNQQLFGHVEGDQNDDLAWARCRGYIDAAYIALRQDRPGGMQALFRLFQDSMGEDADATGNAEQRFILGRMSEWAGVLPAGAETFAREIRLAVDGLDTDKRAIFAEKVLPLAIVQSQTYGESPAFIAAMEDVRRRPSAIMPPTDRRALKSQPS